MGSSPIPVIKDIDRHDFPAYKASEKKKKKLLPRSFLLQQLKMEEN